MATLQLRIDPNQMVAGADRAERSLNDVRGAAYQTESAIDRLAKSGGQDMQQLGQATDRAAQRTSALRTSVAGMGGAFSSSRGQIQNVAFQVGDFATQVGAGTSASVALGQQLPQLLGGFGALGAVMGAVVAVGVPLGAALLNMGQEAATLEDQIESLTDAIEAYSAANQSASTHIMDLRGQYGPLAEQMRDVLNAQREIARFDAAQALSSAVSQLSEQFGSFEELVSDTGQTLRGGYEEVLREIIRTTDATNEQAIELARSLEALGNAQGPEAQNQALTRVRLAIEAATSGTQVMEGAMGEVFRAILESERAAAQLAAIDVAAGFTDAADETDRLSRTVAATDLSGLTGQAALLATNMGVAADEAARYNAALNQQAGIPNAPGGGLGFGGLGSMEDGAGLGVGFAPLGFGNLNGPRVRTRLPVATTSSRGGGGRSGGGSGTASAAVREMERVERAYDSLISSLDPLTRASMEFESAQETINEALEKGHINATEAARAYMLAQDRFTEMSDAARDASSEMGVFDSVIELSKDTILDFAMTGQGAMADLAKSIQRAAYEAALFGSGPLGEAFGGGNGLFGFLGSAIGGIFGGGSSARVAAPSFDGGGYTGSGARSGGIDGKGGFPAILHPDEIVTDLRRSRGQGGGMTVNIINNGSNTEVTARQNGPDRLDITIRDGMKQAVSSGQLDREMRGRYGLVPQPQGV